MPWCKYSKTEEVTWASIFTFLCFLTVGAASCCCCIMYPMPRRTMHTDLPQIWLVRLVKPKSVLAFGGSFCNAHSVLSPASLLFSSSCHLRVEFKALEGRLGKYLFNILRVLKESKQRACMLSGPLGSSAGLWTDLREPEVPGLRWFESVQNKGPLWGSSLLGQDIETTGRVSAPNVIG